MERSSMRFVVVFHDGLRKKDGTYMVPPGGRAGPYTAFEADNIRDQWRATGLHVSVELYKED